MILAWLLLLTGLTISAVAIYYSVIGLAAIFAAATIPIYIMGGSLEIAKLVCASWLKANWSRAPALMKWYMTVAVIILMLITSMGIFGFLSKAHSESGLTSGDVTSKIAIYDEKIKTAKENIEANRKSLKQMDEAVDQIMGRSKDERGAANANAVRNRQAKDRTRLQKEITAEQQTIVKLNEERAPIAAEVRKVEAEVGPIKYIAAFVYGDNPDANLLEKAVTWVIIIIVSVFDPLAVIMLLAAQMTFGWRRKPEDEVQPVYIADVTMPEPDNEPVVEVKTRQEPTYQPDDGPLTDSQIEQIKEAVAVDYPTAPNVTVDTVDTTVDDKDQYAMGSIENLDWNTVEKLDQAVAEESDDSKKKELHDQAGRESDSQDQRLVYVQNSEQTESTLWQRLKNQLGPTDRLYKEYGDHKFKDIVVDEQAEPELYAFIERTKQVGPKFSIYSTEQLEYFAERIHELRKN